MYGSYNHGWMLDGWGGMLFGGVLMLLLWIIPILLIIALLKYLFVPPAGKARRESEPAQKTSLDILKDAYARGDIPRDEYLQKRDDLLEK